MLEIIKAKGPAVYRADRRLCLDASKNVVVEESDPRAAYLLVGAGCELLVSEAERLRIKQVNGKLVLPK